MPASQPQVRANLSLLILRDIKSEENLAVSFVGHLLEDLLNEIGFLFPHQLIERIRRSVGNKRGFFSFSQTLLTRGVTEILDDAVSGHAVNESGEFLRLSEISPPDLSKYDPQSFLVE